MAQSIPGRAAVAAVALVVLLAACGSSSSSSSTGAPGTTTASTEAAGSAGSTPVTGSAELCAQRETLKTDVDDLTKVDVVANGASALTPAITKVKDDLQGLKAAATDDLKPQIQALEDSLQQLDDAVKNISSGGASAVATAAVDVAQTGSTLLTSLEDLKC
jgi:hypothetical protein